MDKYFEHEEEFKEALRGHKMHIQLLLPFDKQIEEMNQNVIGKRRQSSKKKIKK